MMPEPISAENLDQGTTTSPTKPNENHFLDKLREKLSLGHQAVMLDDARETLKQNRKVSKGHHYAMQTSQDDAGEQDMMVLGDHTTHIYPSPKPSFDWMKILLGAGLLTAGAGLPAGGYLLMNALKR